MSARIREWYRSLLDDHVYHQTLSLPFSTPIPEVISTYLLSRLCFSSGHSSVKDHIVRVAIWSVGVTPVRPSTGKPELGGFTPGTEATIRHRSDIYPNHFGVVISRGYCQSQTLIHFGSRSLRKIYAHARSLDIHMILNYRRGSDVFPTGQGKFKNGWDAAKLWFSGRPQTNIPYQATGPQQYHLT